MVSRLGNVIYWFCTGFAALMIGIPGALLAFVMRPEYAGSAEGFWRMVEIIIAGVLTFLIGRAAKYVLAGR